MYTVGLQSAADAFLLSSLKAQVVLALFVLFILLVFGFDSHKDDSANQSPVFLPGSQLLAIAPFFQRRFEFLNDGFRKTGQTLFQFNLLRVGLPHCRRSVWVTNVIHRKPSSSCPERRGGRSFSPTGHSTSRKVSKCYRARYVSLFLDVSSRC